MKAVSLEALLEAGCHFGHQVSRQNPKAREFIFESRDNIHIIDLEKTKEGLEEGAQFIKEVGQKNGTLLIVGTKRQADALLKEEAKRLKEAGVGDVYFVTKRWIGGTLTNFAEVSKNYKKLKDIKVRLQDEYEKAKFTKKEISDWDKDRQKLEGFYGGVADMPKVPDAVFIIDTHLEHVAAKEARRGGIPTVGITDTNADPTIINYPIPANDDAIGSLQLVVDYIVDAWIEGKNDAGKAAVKKAEEAEKVEEKKESGSKNQEAGQTEKEAKKTTASKKTTKAKKDEKEA